MNGTRQNNNNDDSNRFNNIPTAIINSNSFSAGPTPGNFFWSNPLMSINGNILKIKKFKKLCLNKILFV